VQPVLQLLRAGVYVGFGLALGLGLRALRDRGDPLWGSALAERGERAVREILAAPAVSRTTERAYEVTGVLASRAGRVVDEAHDTVEEAYGRFHLARNRLRRAALPAWLRRDLD
jgi:hypothetical protein